MLKFPKNNSDVEVLRLQSPKHLFPSLEQNNELRLVKDMLSELHETSLIEVISLLLILQYHLFLQLIILPLTDFDKTLRFRKLYYHTGLVFLIFHL